MVEQGSEEWLFIRQKCAATCSEYGNALGVGYCSRAAYMRRKLGLDPPTEKNWIMRKLVFE